MSFFGFIKKTARFVKNSFNAVVGAAASTVTAGIATAVAAVALPFVVAGVSYYVASSFKRRFNAFFLSSAVIGLLAGAGSIIGAGLIVATGIIASPFLGLARGFKNGFKAALIPSILYYTVYDRYRERDRLEYEQRFNQIQERAEQRRVAARGLGIHEVPRPEDFGLAASPQAAAFRPLPANNSHAQINRAMGNINLARAGLARYVNDPQLANDKLVEKLSKLNPTPDANFAFLSAQEIETIQAIENKSHPAHALLTQYQQALSRHNGCSISASALDEIKHPLTIEFKQGDHWHHYNYEADDYLLYIRSRPRNSFADLPENRFKLDGRELELGEGNGDLYNENIKIYKGLHPEIVATLKREVTPLTQQLRAYLPNQPLLSPRSPRAAYSPRVFGQRQEGDISPILNGHDVVLGMDPDNAQHEGVRYNQ